jgi:ATP-binding cassette subfamily B protein
MPVVTFTHTPPGELVSRAVQDADAAPTAVLRIASALVSPLLSLALTLGIMLRLSWLVTVVCVGMMVALLPISRRVGATLTPLSREQAAVNSRLRARFVERLTPVSSVTIRLNGALERECRELDRELTTASTLGIKVGAAGNVIFLSAQVMGGLIPVGVYLVAGSNAATGDLSIGTVVALAAYAPQLYAPLVGFNLIRIAASASRAVLERIFELLDHRPVSLREGDPDVGPWRGPGVAPVVSLDGVWFRYPDPVDVMLPSLAGSVGSQVEPGRNRPSWVLQDVSLSVARGQMLAIVGASGAGKSTIAGLLCGLFDPVRGAVRFEGRGLADWEPGEVIARIGVVSQETFLFHDTLRANIAYGCESASDAEVAVAVSAAHLEQFVASLPEGLATVVGENGFRLSGGERQRVGIARMILKDPSLMILDEATAHLDSISEQAVQSALAGLLAGRTSVVIAHRLSTIRNADQIVVLDGGRIVETGTHDELIGCSGFYTKLYRMSTAAPRGHPTD